MQAELLAALPAVQRPAVRLLLNHAARTIPLRGGGKASFLQALDVARAAARRVGEHLAADGVLSAADDVFYLTVDEIVVEGIGGESPAGALAEDDVEEVGHQDRPSVGIGSVKGMGADRRRPDTRSGYRAA